MSDRNRVLPLPHARLPPHVHEPPFLRNLGPMPRPSLLEEMREPQFGVGPRGLPPHPAILEERLGAQIQEIQGLLADNQRVASTHVALKQELEVAHFELQRMSQYGNSFHAEKDIQLREMHEKSAMLEMELHQVDAMKADLMRAKSDIKELTVARQDLMGQVQAMSHDLNHASADLHQVPAIKAEIELMKKEIEKAKAAIEYEKKVYADSFEQGQMMQNNLLTMTRELEKLRAEIANAEKRARAAAAAGASNPAAGYVPNYGNPGAGYAGSPYPVGYGVDPAQAGMQNYPQFAPVPGAWGSYGMQHGQGHG